MMSRTNRVNALKYFAHTQDPYALSMLATAMTMPAPRGFHSYDTLAVDPAGNVYGARSKFLTSWMGDWTPLNIETRSLVKVEG